MLWGAFQACGTVPADEMDSWGEHVCFKAIQGIQGKNFLG